MPRRNDIHKILIIGSGPIVIGQACEFDYSGTQACKVLSEEGYEVVLVNSNPATIMTDPEFADRTYIEPLTPSRSPEIIERERPDALLPTLGGQTGLNLAVALAESGVLERYGVELIGANAEAIQKAEDRDCSATAMRVASGSTCRAAPCVTQLAEAERTRRRARLPADHPARLHAGRQRRRHRLQPGGVRGASSQHGLRPVSPIHRSWSRSRSSAGRSTSSRSCATQQDNVVIVCSIENFDPMGVHTGDSITVAPAQTLTDKEYQVLRDAAIAIIREIGVETGGSNIQFAVNPADGRHGRHRDEPARVALARRWPPRPPASPSPRSPPSWRSATRWTRSRTTSPARRRPASSRPSTTAWSRSRAGPSRSSPGPTARSTTQMKSRRRGDGHRPHVQGGAAEGAALAGAGRVGLGAAGRRRRSASCAEALASRPRCERFDLMLRRPSGRAWSRRRDLRS